MNDLPYITERTRMWRSRDIKPHFLDSIDRIGEFGCYNLRVFGTSDELGFTYSTGIYDTTHNPELISVGLSPDTAHHAMLYAFELMASGVDLTTGRHKKILGDVECEFHLVHPKWLHHTMLRTDWYYEGAEVPVLQLVYPDLENRFAGEEDFNEYFRQPTLVEDVPFGKLEQQLWNMTV
jgi:hypothetical protein